MTIAGFCRRPARAYAISSVEIVSPQPAGVAASEIQSAQQRLGMAMDFISPRQPQPSFPRRFSPPATANIRSCVWPVSKPPSERLRQRMGFALEAGLSRPPQRQQRVSQRPSQQNPQPRIHRAQSRIQQLEYRLTENIPSLTVKRNSASVSATRSRIRRRSACYYAGARPYGFDDKRTQGAEKHQTGQSRRYYDHATEDHWP